MNTKIQGIYKIRNCINGKVYIGQSVDIERRFIQHKRNIINTHNIPIYNSIRKYGIHNFEFIILEEISNVLLLDEREQHWIDNYKSYDRNYGYNLRLDCRTNKGIKLSEEHKRKLSESHKGKKLSVEAKQKLSLFNTGKKLSTEHRLKIYLAHKGKKRKPLSEEHKRKIKLNNKNAFKGKHHTEETKLKMSQALKGKSRKKGFTHSEETKRKLSQCNKGKIIPKETRLKIAKKMIQVRSDKKLGRKRLSVLDIQKLQYKSIIQFKQACC